MSRSFLLPLVCALILPISLLPVSGAMAQGQAEPADETAPACDGSAALPPALAGWDGAHVPVRAAANPAAADAFPLPVGQAVDATLLPTPDVTYPVRPEKPGGSVSKGGLFLFDVPKAGRYRVALASAAWVDVIEEGAAAISAAHGRGPACSSIRKMVDYDLKPGRHLLQISANGSENLTLMVTQLP